MSVDKDLFMYGMVAVTVVRDEAPYMKEWIEYHLLAGANHFYICDHESPDNLKEVLQPYIDAGLVTYFISTVEGAPQVDAYNDAIKKYKFLCRYMAFVDCDEFIFPKSKPTISEVLDDILKDNPQAGAVGINWHCFGSNFQEKADYSRGVMERFTRRAPTEWGYGTQDGQLYGNWHIKTVSNPRKVYIEHVHGVMLFDGCYSINSDGKPIQSLFNNVPPLADKIIVNHYYVKSLEEAAKRRSGDAARHDAYEKVCNEVFDDGILKYRDARKQELNLTGGGGKFLEKVSALNKIDYNKNFSALAQNLIPTFTKYVPPEFLQGKLETFLTCRALAVYLKENLLDETTGKFFEESALNAVYKTITSTVLTLADVFLLIAELPNLLQLKYPVVKNIVEVCLNFIPQLKDLYRDDFYKLQNYYALEYVENLLRNFDNA